MEILMLTITDKEFRQLSEYIKSNFGINLKEEKRSLLTSRLNSILEKNNFNSFSEYYKYLISDKTGEAVTSLVNKITTNYTYFMRETDHFYYFRDVILPYLENHIKDRDLRIWSAGCATGEEPYTLAFILDEYFSDKKYWDKQILATDISIKALNTAKEGIYDEKQIETLPAVWRHKYFKKLADGKYIITDNIKKEVIFRRLNLISDSFVFKKQFHVIFCRNVMIYFDNKDTRELIKKFYDITAPGGYLFIGHSEAINRYDTGYKYVMPSLYRKI